MAIMTDPAEFAAPVIKLGPKTAMAVLYVAIAAVAIAIGVPAALATGDVSGLDECTTCAAATELAAN